jgi:DNA-binding CsgD family transcriptional regulator
VSQSKVSSRDGERTVGAAAEAVFSARGDIEKLKRVLEHSDVPMVVVDGRRRYVEVNRLARLWFRLSLDELRTYAIGDLTPAPRTGVMEQSWERLLGQGSVAGRYPVDGSDGSRLDVVYCGLANILPGLHLIAFMPADELGVVDDAGGDPGVVGVGPGAGVDPGISLTPREVEVLALAADGYSGPELAQQLVLSPATVNTHFKNIYGKLDVRTRAAAVAKALRLGMID